MRVVYAVDLHGPANQLFHETPKLGAGADPEDPELRGRITVTFPHP
jgi:hypothetical protein